MSSMVTVTTMPILTNPTAVRLAKKLWPLIQLYSKMRYFEHFSANARPLMQQDLNH